MNKELLTPVIQDFIDNSLTKDLSKLPFAKSPFSHVSMSEIMQQISGKLKAKNKLPFWYSRSNIYYPAKLNLEQTSSELTAQFKASLFSGKILADITGGFGIDSYFFSKQFESVTYFEQDKNLCSIAAHNFISLGASNIICHNKDGVAHLKGPYDLIYVDPARRDHQKNKVFKLDDCSPNVVKHLDLLLDKAKHVLVKTSPMLDISLGIEQLKYVRKVYAIAVQNELKELLWVLNKNKSDKPLELIAVQLAAQGNTINTFNRDFEQQAPLGPPLAYLYIPNAALMKLGTFNALAKQYKLHKLHASTHIFSSDQLIDFPGRCFKVKEVIPYQKKHIRPLLKSEALVISRNFPLSVAQIRKQWKIADKGNNYLIFTTLEKGEKVVLKCESF